MNISLIIGAIIIIGGLIYWARNWIKKNPKTATAIGIATALASTQLLPTSIPTTLPIIDNGRVIEFIYTDDNEDEDLIIRTSQDRYMNIGGNITVYYSVLNNSSKDQWVKTAFSFSDDTAENKVVKNIKEYKGEKEIVTTILTYSTATDTTTTKEEIMKTGIWKSKLVKSFDVANPDSFQRKELKGTHASKINEFNLLTGEIKIFKVGIKYLPDLEEEQFFLEAFGSEGSYGHLDPWTYEQLFNTLNDGDLNGQDSWAGDVLYDIIEDPTGTQYEGAKSVRIIRNSTGDKAITRSITAINAGLVYVAMQRSDATSDRVQFELYEGASLKVITSMRGGGNFQAYNHAISNWVTITTYNASQWYVLAVEFDNVGQANKFRCKVHNGTSWSSWTSWLTVWGEGGGTYTNIDGVNLWTAYPVAGGTNYTAYYDTITPTDPTAVERRSWWTIPN